MNIQICLFFTYNMSLKKWDELGLLEREILLYKELVRRGAKVTFFTYGDKSDLAYTERLPWIKIIPAYVKNKKRTKIGSLLNSFWLPIIFLKEFSEFDILKTNQMWGAWVPLVAKWLTGKRLLIRCGYELYQTSIQQNKSYLIKYIFFLISKLAYLSANYIVLTSKEGLDFVIRTFRIPKNKISIYPNPIDTELFDFKEIPGSFYRRVLFIGRFHKEKNLFTLIKACKKANVGLDLIGQGELKRQLEDFADRINTDVRFLGVYSNNRLPEIIVKYPVFILPSFYEGNPKVLLEAMSCGRVVIGSNVNGIREIIKDGENGILCSNEINEIASAISSIMNCPELRMRLGKNARKYVVEHCNIKKIADIEIEVYRRMLNLR